MANQPNPNKPEAPVAPKAPAPVTVAKEVAPVKKEGGDIKPVRRNELKSPKHSDTVQGIKRDRH